MAENKNKILVYKDWISTFESLSDEEAGKLIKHFFRYINDQNPESPDRLTSLLFEPIKQTLKRDLKAYEAICLKNKDNVNERWNKKNTTVYDRIRNDTKHTDNDSDNDRKKKKIKYADFVSMTPEEYDKLVQKHGSDNTTVLIDILNSYKGSNGKKYKSDYLAILNWVVDRAKKDGKIRMRVLA